MMRDCMSSPSFTVYTYANCDTCRRASQWLKKRKITFVEKPIRQTPPSLAELRAMLAAYGGDLRRLFNTAGQDYRALDLKTKLPRLSEKEALDLLAANGNLVKRPFLLGPHVGLVGFDETVWSESIG